MARRGTGDERVRRPRLRRRPRSRWRTGPATSPSTATRATTARRASTDSTSRSSGGTRTVGGEGGGTAATRTESRAESPRAAAAARRASDSDSDSDDATPLEPLEGDRARRVFLDAAGDDIDDADGIHVENENDARIRAGASSPRDSPDFPETFFPETRETRARASRRGAARTDAARRVGGPRRRHVATRRALRSPSRDRRQTTNFYCADGEGAHLGSLESEEAPRALSLTLGPAATTSDSAPRAF